MSKRNVAEALEHMFSTNVAGVVPIPDTSAADVHYPTLSLPDSSNRALVSGSETNPATALPSSSEDVSGIITLNVGGRKFCTRKDTLENESSWFQSQLSGRWTWPKDENGAYFLDADPDLFEHLLRFMRRPTAFPLFWSKDGGFDYNLYNMLEQEADFFQIDRLVEWIKAKKYLDAVEVISEAPVKQESNEMTRQITKGGEELERYHLPRCRKVYICPRQIWVHRGEPDKCGQQCAKAQGDKPDRYENEEYVEVVTVHKTVRFNDNACRES